MENSTIKDLEKLRDYFLHRAGKLSETIDILKEEQGKKSNSNNTVLKIQSSQENLFTTTNKESEPNDNTSIVAFAVMTQGVFVKKKQIDNALASHSDLTPDVVRSTLTYLRKKGTLISVQATKNNVDTFWGLTEWIKDGKIKEEHMYDRSTLVSKE